MKARIEKRHAARGRRWARKQAQLAKNTHRWCVTRVAEKEFYRLEEAFKFSLTPSVFAASMNAKNGVYEAKGWMTRANGGSATRVVSRTVIRDHGAPKV